MNCLLTLRIRDESKDAVLRLAEHIIRAQRLAWLSDGVSNSERIFEKDADRLRENLMASHDIRNIFELETLSRKNAYWRSGYNFRESDIQDFQHVGDLADSTVLISDVQSGSLILEIAIPLASFVAIYLARLYAKDRNEQRQFEARLRTIRVVEDQLREPFWPPESRENLLTRMIDGIGAFDSEIIDGLTIDVVGHKLTVGSQTLRHIATKKEEQNVTEVQDTHPADEPKARAIDV